MSESGKAKRFSVRFNLKNEEHKAAWKVLNEVQNGDKCEFIIQAILEKSDAHPLKAMFERMYQSMGKPNADANMDNQPKESNSEISDGVLSFMRGL